MWASIAGIQISDLPNTVQELLRIPKNDGTWATKEEIMDELWDNVYWVAIEEALSTIDSQGEKFVNYLFESKNPMVEKAFAQLIEARYDRESMFTPEDYEIIEASIIIRALERQTKEGKVGFSNVNGNTAVGKILYPLDLKETIINAGVEVRWYDKEIGGMVGDSVEIRTVDAAEALSQENIARQEANEEARLKNLSPEEAEMEAAAKVASVVERYLNKTFNLTSTNEIKALKELHEAFAALGKLGKSYKLGGAKLSDYFNKDGKLKLDANHPYETGTKLYRPSTNSTVGEHYVVGMTTKQRIKISETLQKKNATPLQRAQREHKALTEEIHDGNTRTTKQLAILNARIIELDDLIVELKLDQKSRSEERSEASQVVTALEDEDQLMKGVPTEDFFGGHKRADGKVDKPMGVAKIRLLAKAFLKKLNVLPKIHVFKDVADMKDANPELFKRAAATRLPGEFENTPSMGFAMGSDVIIFSDFIKDARQLQHTIAHEIIGHYGLRSILSNAELKRVLMDIYNNDPHIRLLADRTTDLHDISLLEAIEEVIADKAAAAEISTIVKIWNAIKNALNKLGLTFGDEAARYWVSHLRRYAKTGESSFANAEQIKRNIRNAERNQRRGRFAIAADHANIVGAWHQSHAYNNTIETWFGSAKPWRGLLNDPTFKKYADEAGGITKFIGKALEAVQTLNNKANRSMGLTSIYRFFQNTGNKSKDIMNHLEKMLPTKHLDGTTAEQKKHAFQILSAVAMFRGVSTETLMRKFRNANVIRINPETGRYEIDAAMLDRLIEEAHVSLKEIRAGMKIVVGETEEKDGQGITQLPVFGKSDESSWIHDESITEESPEFLMYIEHRKAIAHAAAEVLLGETQGAFDENKLALADIKRTVKGKTGKRLTDDDIKFFDRLFQDYLAIKNEGDWNFLFPETDEEFREVMKNFEAQTKKAEAFLASALRGIFKDDKISDLKKAQEGKGEDADILGDKKYNYILENVERIRKLNLSENQVQGIQNIIQNLWLNDSIVQNQQAGMLRTVLGAYVPFIRDGKYQVAIKAYKVNADGTLGNPISVNVHTKSMLLYTQTNELRAAKEMAKDFNANNIGTVELSDTDGTLHKVRLVAEHSESRLESPRAGPVGYNDLVQSLTATGIRMNPTQREIVIKKSASFTNKARKSLPRSMSPGFEQEKGLKYLAAYLETQAHVAAKSEYRHKISRVMNNDNMWKGDDNKLKELAGKVDRLYEAQQKDPHNDRLKAALSLARTEFDRFAYMYRHSRAAGLTDTLELTVGGKDYKLKLEGKGERYRDEATRVVAWYEQSTDVVTSTEDKLSGALGAKLKMVTVLGQLGGNLATALVNLTSIHMHTIPYLAYYNEARGTGGGFGLGKASTAVHRAIGNTKNYKFGTEVFLADMVKLWPKGKDDNWVNNYGLTLDEAEFLLRETRLGVLSPAQFNALAGSARGGMEKALTIKVVKGWMYMFTYTEQLNRRATALATYRLQRERLLASNPNMSKQELRLSATREANKVVDETQGNYDMYNRPQMARGNIFQYPFMYKQFVLTSIQMLAAMPVKSRLAYLGIMLLVAGFKGVPFSDDLFDLIDTLAQFFGIKMSSIEMEAHKMIDGIAPGMSPYVMNGVFDNFSGATISTRLGHGDLIPLTGMYKAGSSFERETENLLGPVWAMFTGLLGSAGSAATWVGEALGVKADTTTLNDIARESPIAALRAVADGYAYARDGSITNASGKVVSKDMTTATVIARIMGFYPAAATKENRVVKIAKGMSDYTASIRKEFQVAYVKAKISKNYSGMNNIMREVREWNNNTRGTEFYIRNFTKNANRAAREAMRPTAARYLKSSPKGSRRDTQWLMDLYGIR